MSNKFQRKHSMEGFSEINVTPLIDLAFCLLIIFMITTPLMEQTISLNLPTEAPIQQIEAINMKFQIISIDAAGHYHWGKKEVAFSELDELLKELSHMRDTPILRIRGEANLPYQKIVDVLDLVKRHNITKISLDTQVQ